MFLSECMNQKDVVDQCTSVSTIVRSPDCGRWPTDLIGRRIAVCPFSVTRFPSTWCCGLLTLSRLGWNTVQRNSRSNRFLGGIKKKSGVSFTTMTPRGCSKENIHYIHRICILHPYCMYDVCIRIICMIYELKIG